MQFILTLKELRARSRWVLPGVVVSLVLASAIVLHAPPFASSGPATWTANTQVLVDAHRSAVGDLNQGLDQLIPRATVYANLMTSDALVTLTGRSAGVPSPQISVAGPIGTNGKRQMHSAPAATGQPAYSLVLDSDITQPTIRIAAQAPTRRSAVALASGAATGLAAYVTHLEVAQQVAARHQVNIRQLGAPSVSKSTAGLPSLLAIPIFLAVLAAWCMLVLFVSRFVAAWREAPDLPAAHLGRRLYGDRIPAELVESDSGGYSASGEPDQLQARSPDQFQGRLLEPEGNRDTNGAGSVKTDGSAPTEGLKRALSRRSRSGQHPF